MKLTIKKSHVEVAGRFSFVVECMGELSTEEADLIEMYNVVSPAVIFKDNLYGVPRHNRFAFTFKEDSVDAANEVVDRIKQACEDMILEIEDAQAFPGVEVEEYIIGDDREN